MKIAICDDNKEDALSVINEIKKYNNENNKGWTVSYYESGETFIKEAPETDVVLLDIEMPELNGIDTGRKAKKINSELKIIMFTGAEGYGEDIFDIGAIDYAAKPVDNERVLRALLKVEAMLIGDSYITVYRDWQPYEIPQKEIDYIKAFNGYSLIYSKGKEFRHEDSLTELVHRLDKRIFLRTHRKFIVNLMKIKDITSNGFLLEDNHEILIAKRNYNEIKKAWVEFDLKYNR